MNAARSMRNASPSIWTKTWLPGLTIAQDERSAEFFEMPAAAIDYGKANGHAARKDRAGLGRICKSCT
jgi:hypothetical protein